MQLPLAESRIKPLYFPPLNFGMVLWFLSFLCNTEKITPRGPTKESRCREAVTFADDFIGNVKYHLVHRIKLETDMGRYFPRSPSDG